MTKSKVAVITASIETSVVNALMTITRNLLPSWSHSSYYDQSCSHLALWVTQTFYSYHHQGVDELGKGLVATAWSDANGHELIEAIEHESLPVWSVQWHPERMTGPVTNPAECVDSMPIFEHFIAQCKQK